MEGVLRLLSPLKKQQQPRDLYKDKKGVLPLSLVYREQEKKIFLRGSSTMSRLSTRDAQGYPLQGVDVVPEQSPPPTQTPPLPDLVQLLQEARRKEQAAHRRVEHWHRAYQLILKVHLACQERNMDTPASDCFEFCPACSGMRRLPSLGAGDHKAQADVKKPSDDI